MPRVTLVISRLQRAERFAVRSGGLYLYHDDGEYLNFVRER